MSIDQLIETLLINPKVKILSKLQGHRSVGYLHLPTALQSGLHQGTSRSPHPTASSWAACDPSSASLRWDLMRFCFRKLGKPLGAETVYHSAPDIEYWVHRPCMSYNIQLPKYRT